MMKDSEMKKILAGKKGKKAKKGKKGKKVR